MDGISPDNVFSWRNIIEKDYRAVRVLKKCIESFYIEYYFMGCTMDNPIFCLILGVLTVVEVFHGDRISVQLSEIID
jgi:hypothetical protein